MRRSIIAAFAIITATIPAGGHASSVSFPVAFSVDTLHEPQGISGTEPAFANRTIHGTLFQPACEATTVVILMHGLSYTRAAWNVAGYSVVEPLLDAGFAVVTIDRLGYGESELPNGYNISSEGHAFIAAQIVEQVKHPSWYNSYDHVILGGHSAGAEVTMLSAGLFGGPDAIAVLGYHHVPSPEIVTEFVVGDSVRALQDDYEHFLDTPEHRADMFFTSAADPDVVAADAAAAVLTLLSIGNQPSREVVAATDVPVFLQLGDSDRLFPVEYADEQALLFASAPSVTTDIVASAGHTFMLHPTGPAGSQRLATWASSVAPACA